uniref:Uncharacterized protein n=1 Tax=Trepomonas sp. PC1 TaxID=1076344 RepID=A0A146K7F8_9EUKA|eukprot:JAP92557.1 Hypothetical protein TPC1_15461 [Trepomonas sp. PC1]
MKKQADEKFLTSQEFDEIQLKLANYEVILPNGPYNAQYEEAKQSLQRAKINYSQMQREYDEKMSELKQREIRLNKRTQALEKQKLIQEQLAQVEQQKVRDIELRNQKVKDTMQQQIDQMQALKQEIMGSAALLRVLENREKQYSIYTQTLMQLSNELLSKENKQATDEFDVITNIMNAQAHIKSLFGKLNTESTQASNLEHQLQSQVDQIAFQHQKQLQDQVESQQKFDQQVQSIQKQIETEKSCREQMDNEYQIVLQKLAGKTQELSETYTAIDTLCRKVTFSKRQIDASKKVKLSELCDTVMLNEQIKKLQEAHNIEKEEACIKILGENTAEKLRKIILLNLWLKESEELITICEKQK